MYTHTNWKSAWKPFPQDYTAKCPTSTLNKPKSNKGHLTPMWNTQKSTDTHQATYNKPRHCINPSQPSFPPLAKHQLSPSKADAQTAPVQTLLARLSLFFIVKLPELERTQRGDSSPEDKTTPNKISSCKRGGPGRLRRATGWLRRQLQNQKNTHKTQSHC